MKRVARRSMVVLGVVTLACASGCKPTYKVKPAEPSATAAAPAAEAASTPEPVPAPAAAPTSPKPVSAYDPNDVLTHPTPLAGWTPARIATTVERRSEHYAKRVTLFVTQMPTVKPGNTLFLGDSITEGFPLAEAFPKMNVVNHGIGGDKIEGVHERLGLVAAAKPARIIMKIGTNDTSWVKTAETAQLSAEYGRLLDAIKTEVPGAQLTVLSILPIGAEEKYTPGAMRLAELNAEIKRLCAERGVTFVDIFPAFADENGRLRRQFTTDGVHLTPLGYWQWVQQLHKAGLITDAQMADSKASLGARMQRIYAIPKIANKLDPAPVGNFPGNRGANELVIYLPSKLYPTTGTNEYGMEATVVGDTVQSITREGNAPVPPDGYVISGHGEGAAWIACYLQPGTKIIRNGAALTPVGATMP